MTEESSDLKLVFVYAVDGGLFNSVVHYAHKILAPRTYGCQLCMLTSSALGTEKAWAQFLRELALPVTFLHRDELAAQAPERSAEPLPAVFAQRDGALEVLVHAQEINACVDLQSLIDLVRGRVVLAKAPAAAAPAPARRTG